MLYTWAGHRVIQTAQPVQSEPIRLQVGGFVDTMHADAVWNIALLRVAGFTRTRKNPPALRLFLFYFLFFMIEFASLQMFLFYLMGLNWMKFDNNLLLFYYYILNECKS